MMAEIIFGQVFLPPLAESLGLVSLNSMGSNKASLTG